MTSFKRIRFLEQVSCTNHHICAIYQNRNSLDIEQVIIIWSLTGFMHFYCIERRHISLSIDCEWLLGNITRRTKYLFCSVVTICLCNDKTARVDLAITIAISVISSNFNRIRCDDVVSINLNCGCINFKEICSSCHSGITLFCICIRHSWITVWIVDSSSCPENHTVWKFWHLIWPFVCNKYSRRIVNQW